MIPKAELHVHIEGTMTPSLVSKIGERNGIELPKAIFGPNETFIWADFLDFLSVYDKASVVLRCQQDYRDMVYDYLSRCAKEGALYVEMMISPDHAALCGVSYADHIAGSIQGIDDARSDFGIEGRLIITCVRHFGVEKCIKVAEQAAANPHPYIVGFGMGGDEAGFTPKQFAPAFNIAFEAGLQCTNHAGEMVGPESVWETINHLPVQRIGHGVRAIEDPQLIDTLITKDITLEVCPGSNIALGVYPSFAQHPLVKLRDLGVRVTLSSDDPPYFATTLGQEYEYGKTHFGLSDAELIDMTRNSLQAAFVDEDTRAKLLSQL